MWPAGKSGPSPYLDARCAAPPFQFPNRTYLNFNKRTFRIISGIDLISEVLYPFSPPQQSHKERMP